MVLQTKQIRGGATKIGYVDLVSASCVLFRDPDKMPNGRVKTTFGVAKEYGIRVSNRHYF